MDIMTGLYAVSETLKITKELREIDEKIAVADLKLKLADLVDGLLEAKEALQDAKQREGELLARITDLETQLSRQANLEDEDGCLFELDGSGNRVGEPFCHHCFVKTEKLYRLRKNSSEHGFEYLCDECGKGKGRDRGLPPRIGVTVV